MFTHDSILNEALSIKDEIVSNRRYLHSHPEVGTELPNTTLFVKNKLSEMGIESKEVCPSCLLATIKGKKKGKCILLRSDMDALKVKEATNLPFSSCNSNMHACGHDMHAAMLLGACKLLLNHLDDISGEIKIIFQCDEEGFTGAKRMIESGVMENPKPEAALALHVHSGTPSNLVLFNKGKAMAGCTLFRITVIGKGCHGAMPETGIDPIAILTRIYIAIEEIITREKSALEPATMTIGHIKGGEAPNIIPEEAMMEGTIRTFSKELTAKILKRITEITEGIATSYGAKGNVVEISSAPPLINDPALMDQMEIYAKELLGEKGVFSLSQGGMGSEDFSSYTYLTSSCYLLLGAGSKAEDEQYGYPMHNEKVVFNEDILPYGSALECYLTLKWLER